MMKNAFYFMLKALYVLKLFKFWFQLFGHVGKRLDKKAKVNSKFMTSQTGKQIITTHMFPIVSKTKGNQTMSCYRI